MKLKTGLSLCAALAVVLLVILWLFSRNPRTVYSYSEASYADIASTVTISGKISPEVEVLVRPRISAYVSDVLVECGDKVKKGQRLIVLDAIPDIFALEEANAAVELEKIALKQAEIDFARARELFDGKAISTKEYELAGNALDVAKEHLALAQNRYSIIVNGGSKRTPEHNESIVCSPIDGIVSEILANEGESVSPTGMAICRIAGNGPLVFKGYVDETDMASICEGLDMNLVLGAYPDIVIPAKIVSISSFGKADGGFAQFEIEAALVSVPEGIELRSGFSANAKIVTHIEEHALSVPEECIRFDENHMPYVLRLTSAPGNVRHQRWEKIPVTLGISNGIIIQVTSGLGENDFVQTLAKKKI